jgi:hypothetical protein
MPVSRFPTVLSLIRRDGSVDGQELVKGLEQWHAQLSADDRTFRANGVAVSALTANNALHLNGKVEGALSVLQAASATSALQLGGKLEANLNVNSALFATDAAFLNGHPQTFYTNAGNLSTGTVPTARLGSGTANSTTVLFGNNTWASVTLSIPNANATTNGLMSAGSQTFAGIKVFNANVNVLDSISVANAAFFSNNVTVGNNVQANGQFISTGAAAAFSCIDRSNPAKAAAMFMNGNVTNLWNNDFGSVLTYTHTANVHIANSLSVGNTVNAPNGYLGYGRSVKEGEWTTFTPTWGNFNSQAPLPSIGNGSLTGRCMLHGKTCKYLITLTWGTTTNGGNSSVAATFTLPFNVSGSWPSFAEVGRVCLVETSALGLEPDSSLPVITIGGGTNVVLISWFYAFNTVFAPNATDVFVFTGSYEIA